jgi:hypothetical protein
MRHDLVAGFSLCGSRPAFGTFCPNRQISELLWYRFHCVGSVEAAAVEVSIQYQLLGAAALERASAS